MPEVFTAGGEVVRRLRLILSDKPITEKLVQTRRDWRRSSNRNVTVVDKIKTESRDSNTESHSSSSGFYNSSNSMDNAIKQHDLAPAYSPLREGRFARRNFTPLFSYGLDIHEHASEIWDIFDRNALVLWCYRMEQHPVFQNFVTLMIIAVSVATGIETDYGKSFVTRILNLVALVVFIFEIFVKWFSQAVIPGLSLAQAFGRYLRDPWNKVRSNLI